MRIKTPSCSEFLRGSQHPTALLLAVVGGILLGLTTGPHLTFLALLSLTLLLNLRVRTVAILWALSFGLAWWCQPLILNVGRFALDETPLGATIARLGDGPLLALLGWDQYAVAGGLIAALVVSLPVGKLLSIWTQHKHRTSADATNSDTPTIRWAPFRPGALLAAGITLLISGPIAATVAPAYLEHRLLAELSRANQAEVTASDISLGWADGTLSMSDVCVSDPTQLGSDRLQVAQLTAQINVGALLRGYLDVDQLHLVEVRPGETLFGRAEHPVFQESKPSSASPSTPDSLRLADHVAHWPRRTASLYTLAGLVEQLEQLTAHDDKCAWCLTRERDRSTLGRQQPHWQINSLKAERLASAWGLGSRALIELDNLSSDPQTTIRPTTLKLVAPELGTEIDATLSLRGPQPRHEVSFRSFDLSLAHLLDTTHDDAPVVARGGSLSVRGNGWVDRHELHLALQLEATELDAHCAGPQPLAGLQAETWNEGLRRLNGFRADALLCGTWHDPCLSINSAQLVGQFKHQLRAARQHNLVRAIEAELAEAEQLAAQPPATPAKQRAQDAQSQAPSQPAEHQLATSPAHHDRYAATTSPASPPAAKQRPTQSDRYADYRTAHASPSADSLKPAATSAADASQGDARLYDKMVNDEAAASGAGNVCEGCSSEPNEQLPHDEPGTPIGQPVTATLADSPYPATDTPYAPTDYPSVPLNYAPAQTAVAQVPVNQPYQAQPTSLTGPYGDQYSAPPLPGPVDMQTGYDPLRLDQIIEAQAAATPTQVAPSTAPSSTVAPNYVLEEPTGAVNDDEADIEPPADSRFSRWTKGFVAGAKNLWPFNRRSPAEDVSDPWSSEIEPATTPEQPADTLLAEQTTPNEPATAEDYIATETTLDGDVPLEASKPASPVSRLQFWRNWR